MHSTAHLTGGTYAPACVHVALLHMFAHAYVCALGALCDGHSVLLERDGLREQPPAVGAGPPDLGVAAVPGQMRDEWWGRELDDSAGGYGT